MPCILIPAEAVEVSGRAAVALNDPRDGSMDVILIVFIKNDTDKVIRVPTAKYSYKGVDLSSPDGEMNSDTIMATIKEGTALIGGNMPFPKSDLRIVQLKPGEVAGINWHFITTKYPEKYHVTIKLEDDLATRYNYDAGEYTCVIRTPQPSKKTSKTTERSQMTRGGGLSHSPLKTTGTTTKKD